MRFSIVMPTFNRPQFLPRAANAIIAQDFADWELLVMDGGDSIADVFPKDERIRYYHMPSRPERSNLGLSMARGDILTLQADDDTMLPGALAHVNRAIGAAVWLIGKIRCQGREYGGVWDAEAQKSANHVSLPAVFFRRAAFRIAGKFENHRAADYDYWFRLGARWVPAVTDRALVEYTIHAEQDSVLHTAEMLADAAMVQERARSGYYEVRA